MKPLFFAVAGMFVLNAGSGTALAQAVNRAAVQTAIIVNEKAINDSIVKNDLKTFHSYIAADAANIDGMGVTKAVDFDKMMADYKTQSYSITNSQFLWLDDANVVHMYRWTGKATYQGKPAPGDVWASTVWSNKGGKWLAVYHQESVAMPPPSAPGAANTAPAAAPKK